MPTKQTKSRHFQERLDFIRYQSRQNVIEQRLSEQEILMAILTELMDIRYEIMEMRAEHKERQRAELDAARRVLGG